MRKLILVKHASPRVQPGLPPEKWPLSEEGRQRCLPLADALVAYGLSTVVSSVEPKAAETGELVAGRLGVPFETAAGLHEHDRGNVPHLPSREFISLVELFFRKPGELVLGRETADAAGDRFGKALDGVLAAHPAGNVAVVSHGTVIALLLARHGGGRGFELWREMGLPSYAVLTMPGYRVEEKVASVG